MNHNPIAVPLWIVNQCLQLPGSLLSPFHYSSLFKHSTPRCWLMTVCLLCTNRSFLTFLHFCLSSLLFSSALPRPFLVLGDTYNIPLDPRGKKRTAWRLLMSSGGEALCCFTQVQIDVRVKRILLKGKVKFQFQSPAEALAAVGIKWEATIIKEALWGWAAV